MRADQVEVSWDAQKSNWLIRIKAGEEVIRRRFDLPENADQQALRSAAMQAARDEGYELDPAGLILPRPKVA